MVSLAALVFAGLANFVAAFQLALVAGAPWGHLTMCGCWPGRLPREGRAVAAVSAVLMALMAAVMLGLGGRVWAPPAWAGWLIVGYLVLGAVLHVMTPSRAERRLWLPVILAMLALALVVMLSR